MHKIVFYNKFIIRLHMFRDLCAHHQEVRIVLYSIWYHHICRWPSHAQVERRLVFPIVINVLFRYLLPSIYCGDVLDNILVINLIGDA